MWQQILGDIALIDFFQAVGYFFLSRMLRSKAMTQYIKKFLTYFNGN